MKQKLLILFMSFFIAMGLNAQTHFPIRTPQNMNITNCDTDAFEKLVIKWNAGLNAVQQQVNATNWDYQAFTSTYQSSIDSERYLFYQGARAGTINASNISAYINIKQQKLRALYNSYITNRNNYNSHQPRNGHPLFPNADTPPSCNASCTNMDFGTGDLSGWYGYYAQNSSNVSYNITGMTGGYLGAAQRGAHDPVTNTYQVHITQATERDWFLNSRSIIMSQASPWGNGYSVMLGDSIVPDAQVATLVQEFKVTAADNSMTYAYSALLENPAGHSYYEQPFFSVTLFDSAGDTIKNCGEYFVSSGPGLPGFVGVYDPTEGDTVYWRDWTQVNIPLGSYIGQCVTIQFQVGDCSLSGHFGYAYVDASCENLVVTASSPTGALCGSGGTINLYGPAGESGYHWYGPTNSIITNDTLQNVTVDSLGTYTLVVTPSTGELCKDTLFFKVNAVDTIKTRANMVRPINCAAGTGSASAITNYGIPPYTYSWSNHQTNDTATGLTVGSYTVDVTDSNGCSASASISFTEPSAILLATSYTTATCGLNNGSARVSASGGVGAFTYLWTPGNNTNASVTGISSGTYTITVTDHNGCTTSSAVHIAQEFVTASIGAVTGVSCFGGNNGTATVNAVGGVTPYTYTWSPRGGSGATATGLSAGTYTVSVSDSTGCTVTATTNVTQPAALTANISSISNILCNGGSGTATVTAGGGTAPYTYSWAHAGGNNATGTGLTVGTYTVTVTDHNACTATASVSMTQPAVIKDSITFTKATCDLHNGTATAIIHGGSVPYTYLWNPTSQNTVTATGLSAGTYTLTVTDKNNCSSSATVDVTQPTLVTATITSATNVSCNNGGNGAAIVSASGGNSPYTYLWTPGGNTNAHATGLFALSYTVTVTDANGCTTTASTTLTQPAQLEVNITEPKLICKDSTGILVGNTSGGTAPYTYSWSSGGTTSIATVTPIATRDFSVVVTDVNGCTASGNITLEYGPSMSVDILGKKSVCVGDSTILCVSATGGMGSDTYIWSPGGSTDGCITATPGLSSIYSIQVIDGCGATTTASTTLSTDPYPTVELYSNFTQGCVPLCVQFHNASTITSGGIKEYLWTLGNGDTLASENPVYCYTKAGTYNVSLTVVSDSGCSGTLTKKSMINIYSNPRAAFTYSPQPVSILMPTVQFTDLSTDAYGIAYRWWNFGDGSDSTSNLASPVHTYRDTGTFCANLVVMNDHGCTDTTTNCFIMNSSYSLYIPSAFTPNGDRLNDVFEPVGKYIKSFEMYIFDRWGLEIYHTTDITQGWNGAVHNTGAICQEDTYIYKIIVTDSEGNQHSYVGDITLMK